MATHSSILAWKSPWTEEPGDCRTGTAWEAFINSMHILLEGVKLSFVNPGQGNHTLIMLCRLEYATKTRVPDSQPPREIELVTFS